MCLGCGAWQQTPEPCGHCGWPRLAPAESTGRFGASGQRVDGAAVRVLIEIEIRSDGSVAASRLQTERLPHVKHDANLLSVLDRVTQEALAASAVPDDRVWADLRAALLPLLVAAIDGVLRPRWPGKPRVSVVPVELSFRALVLDPARAGWVANMPWLEIVPLTHALERAGREVKDADLRAELQGSTLGLQEGGNRLRLSLASPTEVLSREVSLWTKGSEPALLWREECGTFLSRGRSACVVDAALPAGVLWKLARAKPAGILSLLIGRAEPAPAGELRVMLLGRESPFRIDVACGDLGTQAQLVDVFLDLGSTTTKYLVRVAGESTRPEWKATARLTEEWGLPEYDKARFLQDKTGALWAKWVGELLPALRRYAAKSHRGYLRTVHLTLPQSGGIPVAELSKSLARGTKDGAADAPLDIGAIHSLLARVATEVVGERALVVHPEHEAVARHYLEPLRILHKAASSYTGTHGAREATRTRESQQAASWDEKRTAREAFDNRGFFYRLFNSRPTGPSGSQPSVSPSLTTPAEWMRRLIERPDLLEHVVLLDAGGLSLDMAVLDGASLVADISGSDASCGGEAVSSQLALRLEAVGMRAEDWTPEKARLGEMWSKSANAPDVGMEERFRRSGGRDQRAYHEVTNKIYGDALARLASACAKRWARGAGHCTVLLTGGASRNPHLQELVGVCVGRAGLSGEIWDARAVQTLLEEARAFSHPLPELESPAATLFSTVHGWALSEVKGSEHMAYDKYAVVGGLVAEARRT
jgi:hypothetical protein